MSRLIPFLMLALIATCAFGILRADDDDDSKIDRIREKAEQKIQKEREKEHRDRDEPREEPRPDRERMEHLHAAMHHLEAADLEELADRVREVIHRTEARREGGPERPDLMRHIEALTDAVRRLSEQNQHMSRDSKSQ